jgi:hypothetical protein
VDLAGHVSSGRHLHRSNTRDAKTCQSCSQTKFVINLTAEALGIEVPPNLSARADEVIE